MRGSERGEAARVAARVEALLADFRARQANASDRGAVDRVAVDGGPGADLSAWPGAGDAFVVSDPEPLAPHSSAASEFTARPGLPADRPAADGPAGDGTAWRPASSPLLLARWWQRLAARVPLRLDPGRRAAVAMGVAVLVAALATGAWVALRQPKSLPVSSSAAPTRAAPTGAAPTGATSTGAAAAVPASPDTVPLVGTDARTQRGGASPAPSLVVVDVAGKVRRPGLYRLPPGSRVDDAVHAAGGALPGVELSGLNLAAPLTDGEQIAVGIPGAVIAGPAGSSGSGGGAGGAPAALVNLNNASLDQLQTLPGVGPVLAQHILDWRTEHGSFASVDQLDDVAGIGPTKFAALKPLVTV